MEHLSWLYPKCQKNWNRSPKDEKKKLMTVNGSLHLHLMFVTQLLVLIQSYRLNLVGMIHEKTKCVLYCKMESTKTENKSCSWFQIYMDSIQEPFNITLEDQIMQDIINFLFDSAVAIISTDLSYLSLVSKHLGPSHSTSKISWQGASLAYIPEMIRTTVTYFMIRAEVVHMLKEHSFPLV